MWLLYLATGAGGALGAVTRVFLSSLFVDSIVGLPFQIFCINVIGCFAMGFLVEMMSIYWSPSDAVRHFLIPGFLGGFTTFSSFSLEFGLLFEKHLYAEAMLYVFLSVFLGMVAFFTGVTLVRMFSW